MPDDSSLGYNVDSTDRQKALGDWQQAHRSDMATSQIKPALCELVPWKKIINP